MSTHNLQIFAERLKRRRGEMRLTLSEIAKTLDISIGAVAAWERGENFPKREKETKLAEILQINSGWLFGEDEKETEKKEPSLDFPQEIKDELSTWASACNISPREFISKCLIRYGQKTADELITQKFKHRPEIIFNEPQIPNRLKHIKSPVIITDRHARTLWFNEAFHKMCGYTVDELKGKNPDYVLQGEGSSPEAIEMLHNAVHSATSASVRIINYHKNGTPYLVHIQMAPVRDESGELLFIAVEKVLQENEESPEKELREMVSKIISEFNSDPYRSVVLSAHDRVKNSQVEAPIVEEPAPFSAVPKGKGAKQ